MSNVHRRARSGCDRELTADREQLRPGSGYVLLAVVAVPTVAGAPRGQLDGCSSPFMPEWKLQ